MGWLLSLYDDILDHWEPREQAPRNPSPLSRLCGELVSCMGNWIVANMVAQLRPMHQSQFHR